MERRFLHPARVLSTAPATARTRGGLRQNRESTMERRFHRPVKASATRRLGICPAWTEGPASDTEHHGEGHHVKNVQQECLEMDMDESTEQYRAP